MKAFQALFSSRRGSQHGFMRVAALVCLVLLALLLVAQAVHLHATQSDADHCQLCIVMHSLVPAAALAAAIVMVQLGALGPQTNPIVIACQSQIRLFIRPPPVSC